MRSGDRTSRFLRCAGVEANPRRRTQRERTERRGRLPPGRRRVHRRPEILRRSEDDRRAGGGISSRVVGAIPRLLVTASVLHGSLVASGHASACPGGSLGAWPVRCVARGPPTGTRLCPTAVPRSSRGNRSAAVTVCVKSGRSKRTCRDARKPFSPVRRHYLARGSGKTCLSGAGSGREPTRYPHLFEWIQAVKHGRVRVDDPRQRLCSVVCQ